MKRKKIFVKAYTAFNLGDDLFLDILFKRYPQVDFILDANNNYQSFCKYYDNVSLFTNRHKSFSPSVFYKLLHKLMSYVTPNILGDKINDYLLKSYGEVLSSCDAFVSIGGSIFMESKFFSYSVDASFYKLVVNILENKPKVIIGANFGPFTTEKFRKIHADVFRGFNHVSFRELYSYNLFKDISTVKYFPDLVFSMKKSKVVDREGKIVGLSLRIATDINYEAYLAKHVDIVKQLINDGWVVKLFSFCKIEGDEKLMNDIYNRLLVDTEKSESIKIIPYRGDITSFLKVYESCSHMICERFHSMILSLNLKQFFIPITYSDKMNNVLSDLEGSIIKYSTSQFINTSVESLINDLHNNYYELPNEIKTDALKHFEIIDKFNSNH